MIDLPMFKEKMRGVKMEINDCGFPLVNSISYTDDMDEGFKDSDYVFLVGSKPRGPGMERKDLLVENGKIFVETGKALNGSAKETTKILVVGNPANTNSLICMSHANSIKRENFSAMTRLDHDRSLYQI